MSAERNSRGPAMHYAWCKKALLHQRSTSASGGARRTKSYRILIMIGYPPTSAFAICEFGATSMSIQGWISGTNPIIDGVPAKASHQQRNLRCGVASSLCPRPCIRCHCRIFDRFALTICTCCLQNTTFRNSGIGFFAKRHPK